MLKFSSDKAEMLQVGRTDPETEVSPILNMVELPLKVLVHRTGMLDLI